MIRRFTLSMLIAASCCALAPAANWNVTRINHVVLPAPSSGEVREMSGVAYVGAIGQAHRFIAVQQDHENVVRFDVTFTPTGGIAGIVNVVNIPIDDDLDFEGIAYTDSVRNSVFLSDEDTPGIFEVSLETGAVLQSIPVPAVYANDRNNLSLESLARSRDGGTMWTANESALNVDGPVATTSSGATVRLLRLDVAGSAVTPGPQYAYNIEPIHASGNNMRSGLCDLVAMPDGALLTLERSAAIAFPIAVRNRIFEVDFEGATDISQGSTAAGLIGKTYTPVSKAPLWDGTADGALGQNLEGLGLGPKLPSGAWVLLGVVDDGSSFPDTVVSFTATAVPDADFDGDGHVNGADFLAWQRGVGKTVGAKLADGDADRDGDVDAEDLDIWRGQQPAPPAAAVPEPAAGAMLVPGLLMLRSLQRPC